MSQPAYNAIVIGGGMIGSICALGLAGAGLRLTLVDRASRVSFPDSAGSRVSALGLASQRMLERLDIWSALPPERLSPYHRMEIWESRSTGRLEFDAAEVGYPHLGHIVENQLVLHALQEAVDAHPSIDARWAQAPAALTRNAAGVRLSLADRDHLQASLLVVADGARSWARPELGIAQQVHDYRQRGIVARIATARPHQKTAWQRFLPGGPLALLPMADGASSIVWTVAESMVGELLAIDDDDFARRLQDALAGRLGAVTLLDQRNAFPLRSARAAAYVADRAVLIGDAAHCIHPLAGQGANLGIKDAAALIEVLGDAHSRGRDVGERLVLRRYERWRKAENSAVDMLMSALNYSFSNTTLLPGALRALGMNALNNLTPVKNLLARQAMGVRGDLPRALSEL